MQLNLIEIVLSIIAIGYVVRCHADDVRVPDLPDTVAVPIDQTDPNWPYRNLIDRTNKIIDHIRANDEKLNRRLNSLDEHLDSMDSKLDLLIHGDSGKPKTEPQQKIKIVHVHRHFHYWDPCWW